MRNAELRVPTEDLQLRLEAASKKMEAAPSEEERREAYKEAARLVRQLERKQEPVVPRAKKRADQMFAFSLDQAPSAPRWDLAEVGDLLLVRSPNATVPNFLWAMRFHHAGMFDEDGGTYESNIGRGVRKEPLSRWQKSGETVAIYRVQGVEIGDRKVALRTAKGIFGTKGETEYNLLLSNKVRNDQLYCSQLVWKTYLGMGVDLDSQSKTYRDWLDGRFPWLGGAVAKSAVAPDELALSPLVQLVATWVNP